jgi:hypothetical protein
VANGHGIRADLYGLSRNPTQLDLFLDSRAVMLANDATGALLARDAERARGAMRRLRVEAPDYPGIDALETLTTALATWSSPGADGSGIVRAVDWLDREVAPAANRLLGDAASQFIAGFFRDLAEAARGLAYDPAWPQTHRASLCLRAGEWEEAGAAADSIPQASANPDAIHWRCAACYRRYGLDAARIELFALAWRAPQRFASVRTELGDEVLDREWQRFEGASDWESVDDSELPAWFPAWYLLERPAVGASLKGIEFPNLPASGRGTLAARPARARETWGPTAARCEACPIARAQSRFLRALYGDSSDPIPLRKL